MLYRRMRRKKIHFNTYHRPLPRAQRILIFLTFNVFVLATAFSILLIQLRPIILKLATAKVSEAVLYSINSIVDDEISKGTLDYSQLVSLEKDGDGNITALTTNMPLMNMLQARISKNVLASVKNENVTDLKIPIGNAIGGVIFSGRGPSFNVKILSVANVSSKFTNDFTAAGINQTRHKIMLKVSVELNIFVPGTKSAPTTVQTEIAVCETVIVGKVPNMYADFGDSGGS